LKKSKVLSKITLNQITDFALSLDKKYLYTKDNDYISIYDISNRSKPSILGKISSKNYYGEMAISKDLNKLFITKYDKNAKRTSLAVIDIKNPKKPREIATIPINTTIRDLKLYKDNLYLLLGSLKDYFLKIDIHSFKIKKIKTDMYVLSDITFFENLTLLKALSHYLILYKNEHKINVFNYQTKWHNFYKRIENIKFTPNGKYIIFIANKNAIGFKRLKTLLPSKENQTDKLYNPKDYFGNFYTSIIKPNANNPIKNIIITKDGTKLLVFAGINIFVYDITKII